MVAGIYYGENDIERIARYCEKDVLAIAQVLLRFMNHPQISEDRIESVTFCPPTTNLLPPGGR
jgi:hypothetical protein